MPSILYELPNWQLGLLIICGWSAVGLTIPAIIPRRWRALCSDAERVVALAVLALLATINALLLAFSAVTVWASYGQADRAVHQEAIAISELGRALAVFGTPEARLAREHLRAYGRAIVQKEWPAMRRGESSRPTMDAFDAFYAAVGDLHPATPIQTALTGEIFARIDDLLQQRSARLHASRGQVPDTWWAVALTGALLTLAPAIVLPLTAFNRCAVTLLSAALGLVFFFVAAMDRPFLGAERTSGSPIEISLDNMRRWDARAAAGRSPP